MFHTASQGLNVTHVLFLYPLSFILYDGRLWVILGNGLICQLQLTAHFLIQHYNLFVIVQIRLSLYCITQKYKSLQGESMSVCNSLHSHHTPV